MRRVALIGLVLFLAAWSGGRSSVDALEVSQISSFYLFDKGGYEGDVSFQELKKLGTFGMGTVNSLDGEMVADDGQFFQIKADGKVYSIDDTEKTPFAMVTTFKAEKKAQLSESQNAKQLQDSLNALMPDAGKIYAIRIVGDFKYLKLRSVPRQQKPYPSLEDALKGQTFFELTGVRGVLVGFRFPEYMKGVNFPGYHFHMISQDRKAGGHLLDCSINRAEVEAAEVSTLNLRFVGK